MSRRHPEQAVLDAGVVLPFVLNDPRRGACLGLVNDLAESGTLLLAPTLFAYETTNALTQGLRAGLLAEREVGHGIEALEAFRIDLVAPELDLCRRAFEWTVDLRRAAAYDSFYLALAERFECDLWTTDLKLVRAVNLPWVRSVPEIDSVG